MAEGLGVCGKGSIKVQSVTATWWKRAKWGISVFRWVQRVKNPSNCLPEVQAWCGPARRKNGFKVLYP